jgi:hypothetical protein
MADADPSKAPDPDPLSWVHAGRLRAAERELTGLTAQIIAIGRDGRNPAGTGAGYTPLKEETWTPLSDLLRDIAGDARRVGELAGAPAAAGVQGEPSTRAAVSARLSQLEEVLRDLHPDRLQARYGELPAAVAAELAELCARMEGRLRAARALLTPQENRPKAG